MSVFLIKYMLQVTTVQHYEIASDKIKQTISITCRYTLDGVSAHEHQNAVHNGTCPYIFLFFNYILRVRCHPSVPGTRFKINQTCMDFECNAKTG